MRFKRVICALILLLGVAIYCAKAQNEVLIDGVKYHVHDVVRGETLYSLARYYGVTVNDIKEANEVLVDGLKAGQRIIIPAKAEIKEEGSQPKRRAKHNTPQPVLEERIEEVVPVEVETPRVAKFATLSESQRAKVALLLPLGSEDRPSRNYLDFYRGFMLGLDSLRRMGISADITLYNTAHDHSRIEDIVTSRELEQADLVVGPIYEDELLPIASSLEGRNVPIVSPLANLTMIADSRVFQMSPAPNTKLDKVQTMFDGTKRVVIISTDNVDKEFDAEVRGMLKDTSYVVEHKYIYEHPSIIEKREKEREKAREAGLEVDDTPSPSDMSPLLRGDKETVIVITANNEIEVDRILAAIASANIALNARSQRVAPFVIFGNNRWNRFPNLDRAILFTNDVIMLSSYHARRSDVKIRRFDARFVAEFGLLPTLYAYRGYDAAVLFVSSLYGAIENGMEGGVFMPLLTPYSFVRDERGVLVNKHWVKVNYNKDFTITTE